MRFEFETAGQKYLDFDLITIKFDKILDEEAGRKAAEETATRWFKERGTDAVLLSCVAKHTRELIYWPDNKVPVSAADPLEDGYSAEMSLDRIDQLIGEMKPYTDRVVLNGWAPSETVEHFQDRLYYVNTFEDPDNKDQYTVIKW